MCGIAGALVLEELESGRWDLDEIVARMTARLAHRGPDGSGRWSSREDGVCLGHRRLAVVDLSDNGVQPMAYADGRFHITFNGEIYNFRLVREELVTRGHRFTSTGDTQVILAAIAEWGIQAAISKMSGMFALAVWDRESKILHLARDRLGEKPLHFASMGGRLFFASELRAFSAIPGFRQQVDRHAVASYLRFGYVPEPFSIYEGVYKLPAGSTLSVPARQGWAPSWGAGDERQRDPIECGELLARRYWFAEHVAMSGKSRPLVDIKQVTDQLESKLRAVIRDQMLCDVPVGCFLSGGVDSSLVAALMQAEATRPVHTFTVRFTDDKRFDESGYAREVARHLGTRHEELVLDERMVEQSVPDLTACMDEPTANGSYFAACHVSRLARQQVTVVLSGDGGDELFAGYNRYVRTSGIWSVLGLMPFSLRRSMGRLLGHIQDFERRGVVDADWYGSQSTVPELVEKARRMVAASDFREAYDQVASCWPVSHPVSQNGLRDRLWSDLPKLPAMLLSDQMDYLPGDNLAKIDRASMSASLETRLPLLDHELVEFSWRVPDSLKIHRGRTKWPMRVVLRKYIPDYLIERPKMGFTAPVRQWLDGGLREWAQETLDSDEGRSILGVQFDEIVTEWESRRSRTRTSGYQIWAVVILAAWMQSTRAVL